MIFPIPEDNNLLLLQEYFSRLGRTSFLMLSHGWNFDLKTELKEI